MKKRWMRLLCAALAVCMMLTAVPASAFADGGATPVSVAAEGATITESGTYLLDKETYTGPIVVETDGAVTLKIESDIIYTASQAGQTNFITVKKGTDVVLDNKDGHTVDMSASTGEMNVLVAESGVQKVVVEGGTYKAGTGCAITNAGENIVLNNVTAHSDKWIAFDNNHGTATVTGGRYTSNAVQHIVADGATSHEAIENDGDITLTNVTVEATALGVYNTGTMRIYGGEYSSREANAIANGNQLDIYGGTYTSYKVATIGGGSQRAPMQGVTNIHGGTFENKAENGKGQALVNYGTMTVDDDYCATKVINRTGTTPAIGTPGKLYFKGGTVTAPNTSGIMCANIAGYTTLVEISGGTLTDCKYGLYVKSGDPTMVLKDVTFENNENDIYLGEGQKITIADSFTKRTTVKVEDASDGRRLTEGENKPGLNLVSNDPGYKVAYNETGKYYYLTPRTAGKFTVDAEDAKAVAKIDGVSTELDANTEIAKDTHVDLTAVAPGAGWELIGWELKVAGEDKITELLHDADTENPWFTMPEGNVTVRALYNFVGTSDAGDSGPAIGGAIAAGIVTGAAAWGVYEAGTGIYRVINMPGIAMPSNRIELALLVWEHADKPEPQNMTDENLYADIDADDTDAQKAAHWMVEQELMKFDEDNNKFHPYFPVTKLRVCTTWEKAKQKGLFDKDTASETE